MESRLANLEKYLSEKTNNFTMVPIYLESILYEFMQLQEKVIYMQITNKISKKLTKDDKANRIDNILQLEKTMSQEN